MIQMIKQCAQLSPYLKEEIEDEGIVVELDDGLDKSKVAIIKVDEYYSGLRLGVIPKSIDFLVVVDCECDWFALYLLELKNVKSPKFLIIKDIQEKFSTTIQDFMSDRFEHIFKRDKFKYKGIKLYLVSDAYGAVGKYETHEQYVTAQEKRNRIRGKDSLRVDVNLSKKLYKFRGKIYTIEYDIPPNPVIRKIS